ncbi:MAG: hypothetical protein M3Q49_08760 [Actinomycetota bacterium]|nr:hypothetical protein [Actinomycetota bacterium]
MTAEGGARAPSWWLIVDRESGLVEVLVLKLAGGEGVLPVFGFEEEAELFLLLGAPGGSPWLARETGAGELASLLLGPLSGVGRVALDPLPGRLGGSLLGPLSVRRQEFVARLLIGRRRPPTP